MAAYAATYADALGKHIKFKFVPHLCGFTAFDPFFANTAAYSVPNYASASNVLSFLVFKT